MKLLTKKNPLCLSNEVGHVLSQVLFYLTLVVYLISRAACETSLRFEIDGFTKRMFLVMWICGGVALFNVVFLCKYSIRQVLGILVFCAFWVFVYYQTEQQEYGIGQSMMIVFSCREVEWNRLKKVLLGIWIMIIAVIVALNRTGVLPSLETYRGDRLRHTLGFSHPNVVGLYVFCFAVLWVMIRFKNIKFYDYMLMMILTAFAWFVPNSKTCTFSLMILIVVTFIFKNWGENFLKFKAVQILCLSAFPLMMAFSYFASKYYDPANATYVMIDQKLFTTRLSLAHAFYDAYPYTLFGQRLKLIGSIAAAKKGVQPYILDNFYVRLLMNDGIVPMILFLGVMVFVVYVAIREKDYGMLAVLLVLSVYCVYEFYQTKVSYNVCLFQLTYGLLKPLEPADISKRRYRRR